MDLRDEATLRSRELSVQLEQDVGLDEVPYPLLTADGPLPRNPDVVDHRPLAFHLPDP